MNNRERDFRKRKCVLAAILSVCLILAAGCGGTGIPDGSNGGTGTSDSSNGGTGMPEGVDDGVQKREEPAEAGERKTETISFGEESGWESWTDYLYQSVKDVTYAFAFIEIGSSQADLDWAYYDDREALTDAFLQEKSLREGTVSWYFLKLRIDSGVCGLEIYDYFKENLAEEGYVIEAWTMNEGNAYQINAEWQKALEEEYMIRAKWKAIVENGYLYFLYCEDVNDDNREEVSDQLYAYGERFDDTMYGGGWLMDEDTFYWSDHTARTTTFEEPARRFVEERASDANWPDKLMGYFGLVSEAEYRIQLAPELPEMTVTFRLKEELPKEGEPIYLWNGFVMDETYQMEIRTVEGEELIQKTDVQLSIEEKDIIYFEDLDADGYLDMRILYPTHESGSEELYIKEEEYWVWDLEKEKMIRISDSELQVRRSGAGGEPEAEEFPQIDIGYVPVTVEKGDSLWKISERYYGDGKYWGQIYEYNQSIIGENPSLIYEGTELIFPYMD